MIALRLRPRRPLVGTFAAWSLSALPAIALVPPLPTVLIAVAYGIYQAGIAFGNNMFETTLQREALRSILGALSERERMVLELRYGLDGQQPRTLDEVGRAFNVTRERIRQIENQGLKKLRALALAAQMRDVA